MTFHLYTSAPPKAVVAMLAHAQALDQCVDRLGPDLNETACALWFDFVHLSSAGCDPPDTTEKQKTAEMYWALGILDWIMYWICFMLLAGCFCFLFLFISFHLISFRLISFPFISSPISSHVPLGDDMDQYLNVDQRQKKPAAKNRWKWSILWWFRRVANKVSMSHW